MQPGHLAGHIMTSQDLRSDWRHVKRSALTRWSRLTETDLDSIQGNPEELVRRLEERYGFASQIVLAEVNHFLAVQN